MAELQVLLQQHVGAPCKVVVAVGEQVKKGTLLAVPQGLGANIYSGVYGTVTDIRSDRVIITPDSEQKEDFVPIKEGSKLEMVKEAGVVGMGGAGFPTAVKIDTDLQGGYVLVNAAECEPGLKHNITQIEEEPQKIIRGARHVMEIANAHKGIFAIKQKNIKAVEVLRAALSNQEAISIHLLPDIYPMGEERAVVRECLGIELEITKLPSAAQTVVLNVETLARITEAIEERKPCFSKNLTVIGQMNSGNHPCVFKDVPVGTDIGTLIQQAGGMAEPVGEIIIGGPFTGKSAEPDTPITKTTGGIILTIPLPDLHSARTGILICACGGNPERMQELVQKMNGEVVSECTCKQAVANKPGGPLKCERPGNCPGQVQNNLKFKKDHCEYIVIGNCSDCSNTVMTSAPKMGLKVIHQTDHVMRTIGHSLYRYLKVSKQVDQLPGGKVQEEPMQN